MKHRNQKENAMNFGWKMNVQCRELFTVGVFYVNSSLMIASETFTTHRGWFNIFWHTDMFLYILFNLFYFEIHGIGGLILIICEWNIFVYLIVYRSYIFFIECIWDCRALAYLHLWIFVDKMKENYTKFQKHHLG